MKGVVPQADRFAGKYGTDVDVSVSLTHEQECILVFMLEFFE